ncbi:3-methyl-2-oxobutanoate hydroxymethyltransferase [soil metagenome]
MSAVRVTIANLARRTEPFACLTCYDATTARLLSRAGVDVLLVGDTAAEMVLGYERTLDMPFDVLIALTAGVARGARAAAREDGVRQPLVMGDMPFMSYHAGLDAALANAARFVRASENGGMADIVKLEADESFADAIHAMSRAGIAVCAHIGSRPQRSLLTGNYSAAGRTEAESAALVRDAHALQDAGCVMLLLEAVPDLAASAVLAAARVPVIGIGAGSACHGQVLVLQDLLGMTDKPPAFVGETANIGAAIEAAGRDWVERVKARQVVPSPYAMKK